MQETVKKSKKYKKLYKKYKQKFVAANYQLKQAGLERSILENKLMDALTRLGRLEHDSAMNVRKQMDLQYMEIDGVKPILWINTTDPRIANAAAFGNIRDRIQRIAKGIEMVILTYGDVKIWEMDAKDLERIGLVRIENHNGGQYGIDAPKRITDG